MPALEEEAAEDFHDGDGIGRGQIAKAGLGPVEVSDADGNIKRR